VAEADPTLLPWGYGHDRITAMVVDPTRLFVYWELTDEGIDRARAQMAPAATHVATLAFRVYDVTGIIFDGTNAHRHLEQPIERRQRHSTLEIGRPGSTVVVEVGLRHGSRFVRVARSRRADFPRREPAATHTVEWRTVTESAWASGEPLTATIERTVPAVRSAPGLHAPSAHRPDAKIAGGSSDWPYATAEER